MREGGRFDDVGWWWRHSVGRNYVEYTHCPLWLSLVCLFFFLFTSVLFLFVDDVREPCVGVPCFGAKLGKHSVVGWSACRLVASVIIGSQLETEKAPASTQPTDPSGCVSLETTVGEIRLKTMYSVWTRSITALSESPRVAQGVTSASIGSPWHQCMPRAN